MKIDLGNLEPGSEPRLPGAFYVRDTRWGPIAQKWPKPRGRAKSLLEQQFRTRFGFAARMAATPYALDYSTALEMSRGTEQVPRDILTMAALGRYYIIQQPDGFVWQPATGPLANTRPELDEMSWQWNQFDASYTASMDSFAAASKGVYFDPPYNDPIYSIRVVFTAVANATYKASHGYANASQVIQAITSSSPKIILTAGLQCAQFDLSSTFVANARNFLLLTRTDAANNYALPMSIPTPTRWQTPMLVRGSVRIVTNAPVVGQTLTVSSGTAGHPFGFRVAQ